MINRYEKQKSCFVANYTRFLWQFLIEKRKLVNFISRITRQKLAFLIKF